MIEAQDKDGRPVKVGSKVRIIELAPHFLASLPDDEERDVRSMIGEIFEVLEITESGYASVEKEWHFEEEGRYMSHSLTLKSNEMELVDG